jgi:hypothetical protein
MINNDCAIEKVNIRKRYFSTFCKFLVSVISWGIRFVVKNWFTVPSSRLVTTMNMVSAEEFRLSMGKDFMKSLITNM